MASQGHPGYSACGSEPHWALSLARTHAQAGPGPDAGLGIMLFSSYLTPLTPGSRLGAKQIGLTSILDKQADAHILLLERAHSELSLQMQGDLAVQRLRLENPEAPAPSGRAPTLAYTLASLFPSEACPEGPGANSSDLSCRMLPWDLLCRSTFLGNQGITFQL